MSVHEPRAPIEVVRVNQRPVPVVEAAVESGGTARASSDVAELLGSFVVPAGVRWTSDRRRRRAAADHSELTLVAVLAVALVFLVLAGEFASFTTPMLIMLTVPLAAAGGIILLWLTGQSLNAVSLIGLVVMVGIADNEAVVKLDAIQRFREQGHSLRRGDPARRSPAAPGHHDDAAHDHRRRAAAGLRLGQWRRAATNRSRRASSAAR